MHAQSCITVCVYVHAAGVYLEDAFQVPKQLMGQTFYAAVVLKVSPTTRTVSYNTLNDDVSTFLLFFCFFFLSLFHYLCSFGALFLGLSLSL